MTVENKISELVLQAAFRVYRALGPGLVTQAYVECLTYEIKKVGLEVDSQKNMPLVYGDLKIDLGYSIDLLVEKRVLIQVKHGENFNALDMAKMQTYLKLSGCKLGFLMNFNVRSLKNGIRRIMADHQIVREQIKTAI
ncbi:MAG: GxxExxY protein [Saprospiraceae bacterium]|nr:GxxExxY protein [Saprospiraceae bacterium]